MSYKITDQILNYASNQEPKEDRDYARRLYIDWATHAGDWSAFEPIAPLIVKIAEAMEAADLDWPAANCIATLALSDDASVKALNIRFRKIDKSTNVLSFPAMCNNTDIADVHFLGDVILASETVLLEAHELDLDPNHHFAHLIIHAVLHLLGYDHQDEAQATAMEQMEIRILAGLGVADPYISDVY